MSESIPENLRSKYLGELIPQEETLEKRKSKSNHSLGIPREQSPYENRIALTPEATGVLVNNGIQVKVEEGAGKTAGFSDQQYSNYGANIIRSNEEVFQSDIILKIAPPTEEELELIPKGKCLISSLNLPIQKRVYFEKLIKKKITALAFEYIQENRNAFPLVRTMSEIIGNTTIFIAAEYLAHPEYGKGILLGGFPGISPSEIVIIGAGTVGEYAARTAAGLGAMVKVFDKSITHLRRIQEKLGSHIFTSVMEKSTLEKAILQADVVISAKYVAAGTSPCIIHESLIKKMRKKSIIIDVSIDQGGFFETSKRTNILNPVFVKHGITHYCVPNIASGVPHTASKAFSNIFGPILKKIHQNGGVLPSLRHNYWLSKGVYILSGINTNKFIGDHYNLPYQDIDLLMAAYQ
ncbi:MAG: alanine dehydrogenase [Bacteroidales bacterium]